MVCSLDANDVVAQAMFPLKQQVPLAAFTSYRVGGTADWFALPKTPAEVIASLQWAANEALPVTFLGSLAIAAFEDASSARVTCAASALTTLAAVSLPLAASPYPTSLGKRLAGAGGG